MKALAILAMLSASTPSAPEVDSAWYCKMTAFTRCAPDRQCTTSDPKDYIAFDSNSSMFLVCPDATYGTNCKSHRAPFVHIGKLVYGRDEGATLFRLSADKKLEVEVFVKGALIVESGNCKEGPPFVPVTALGTPPVTW